MFVCTLYWAEAYHYSVVSLWDDNIGLSVQVCFLAHSCICQSCFYIVLVYTGCHDSSLSLCDQYCIRIVHWTFSDHPVMMLQGLTARQRATWLRPLQSATCTPTPWHFQSCQSPQSLYQKLDPFHLPPCLVPLVQLCFYGRRISQGWRWELAAECTTLSLLTCLTSSMKVINMVLLMFQVTGG